MEVQQLLVRGDKLQPLGVQMKLTPAGMTQDLIAVLLRYIYK